MFDAEEVAGLVQQRRIQTGAVAELLRRRAIDRDVGLDGVDAIIGITVGDAPLVARIGDARLVRRAFGRRVEIQRAPADLVEVVVLRRAVTDAGVLDGYAPRPERSCRGGREFGIGDVALVRGDAVADREVAPAL